MEYPFEQIERKWQKKWQEVNLWQAKMNPEKKKYYVLSMFPYSSGALHMGHVSNYSIADAITRYFLMKGYNVFQPMGYDSFGLPAENFAIQNNTHPQLATEDNIKTMRKQFDNVGFGLDWSNEISTSRPDYYKWNQWLFKRFYEKGLVIKKKAHFNWCTDCQTVLANEQVLEGNCWRCDEKVVLKEMEQWFLKITDYAEELLDFSNVSCWPERVITMQKNWIWKSEGSKIYFKLIDSDKKITVFTTRPDTIFGCTYLALPPEHPIVINWLKESNVDQKVKSFCEKTINSDSSLRTTDDFTKEGVFSGKYCINPVNGDKIPIWITNYVLVEYGTGAVMAVPAHDQRDFEFAKKHDLHIKIVIQNQERDLTVDKMKEAYLESGFLTHSDAFNDMDSISSMKAINSWMEEQGIGNKAVTYKLKDWGISRQRYWGTPIPIIHCNKCGSVLVPDEDLPVELPVDIEVGKTRQNPLLSAEEWLNVKCPKCRGNARRETDTMDTFVDSSWYYARFIDSHNKQKPFSKEKADYWLPVDQYIGGIEHACMHLMYARFIHKVLRDLNLLSSNEPFKRLLTQGMVIKDGAKMSKSKGNVVEPLYMIDRYGADTVRVFMLFASPPDKDVEWNDEGVMGAFRFLNRVWRLINNNVDIIKKNANNTVKESFDVLNDLRYSTHLTIKKVYEDIENRMHFNTAIASIMEHLNNVTAIKNVNLLTKQEQAVFAEACLVIPRLLYPFAPHIAEELWQLTGHKDLIHEAGVLQYRADFLKKDEITYVIQIKGKVRGKMTIPVDTTEDEIRRQALKVDNVEKYIQNKTVKKIVVVKNKLVSIVV